MTTEGSASHAEEARGQVNKPVSAESKAVIPGGPSFSAKRQQAEAFHPQSEDDGRAGQEPSAAGGLSGGMGGGENTPGKIETAGVSSPSAVARLVSILGEIGHAELGEALGGVSERNAATPGGLFPSADHESAAAFRANSGADENFAERPADTPSDGATGDAGRVETEIDSSSGGESSRVAVSGSARMPSLLAGLTHVQLNQVEKLVGLYQSEWQARSQQDQLNRDLVLRAERQKAELDLQKERFTAEQAKLEADLEHQQELARLEARKESTGELIRSVVLLLVILAVVLTPLLAMGWLKVPPQSFSQYVAPITGITGTVLGYWFGRQDPKK